jgi:hypothetical protein
MRTFGMWFLAGLFALAGWDAFERMDREARPGVQGPQDSEVRAMDDGTPPPPPPLVLPTLP